MAGPHRQLRILGVHAIFTYPFACIPYLYFYFADHGVELDDYMWLISLYYWAMVIMEVPTGLFADRFGRRQSLLAGSTMLAVGFATIFFGGTFATFGVGEICFGMGHSLLSGAPTALLFDTLRQHDQQHRFLAMEGRIHALRLLGTGGSFLIGGVLATLFGLDAAILATSLLCLCGALLALRIDEPKRLPRKASQPPLLRAAVRDLRQRPLLWLIGYYILLFALLRFAFHTYQPYFKETVLRDDPTENWIILGLLFAGLNLFAAPFSRLAPRLQKRFPALAIYTALPTILCLAFLAMAALPNWLGVLLFFAHQIPFALHWAIIQNACNQQLESASRATALSILSVMGRLFFALVIPIVGVYEHAHGTPATYGLLGAAGLVYTLLWCAPGLGARLLKIRS